MLTKKPRHLKPGGYVEIQELHYHPRADDDTLTPETPYALASFLGYLRAGLRALGADLDAVTHAAEELTAAGFENVTRETQRCPIGAWPRDLELRTCGVFLRTSLMDGLRGWSRKPFGEGLGWTRMQIEMFLVDVRRDIMDAGFHAYIPFYSIYGRKPMS